MDFLGKIKGLLAIVSPIRWQFSNCLRCREVPISIQQDLTLFTVCDCEFGRIEPVMQIISVRLHTQDYFIKHFPTFLYHCIISTEAARLDILWKIIDKYNKRSGSRMEPCGTPHFTG